MAPSLRTANCALVRYDGGHTYVDRADGHSRREVYVELKGVKDLDHARAVATEILQHDEETRETMSYRGTVHDTSQIPTSAYALGDKMDGRPIVSIDISSDLLGAAKVSPSTGDPFQLWVEAMDRRIARWASGAASEQGAPVINEQDQAKGTDTTAPELSLSGEVTKTLSPAWVVPRPFHVSWVKASLRVAGSTSTRLRLYATDLDGTTTYVATVTLRPGATEAVAAVNRGFPAKWKLGFAVDVAGGAARDLSASLVGAMV